MLGDVNAEIDQGDTLQPTIWSEISHRINNDNVIRVIKFSTLKILFLRVQHLQVATLIN
jgi:hypothetical protein